MNQPTLVQQKMKMMARMRLVFMVVFVLMFFGMVGDVQRFWASPRRR